MQKGKKSPEEIETERKQENAEMSKNQLKKLAKEIELQKGLHSEYEKYTTFLMESGKSDDLNGYEAYLEQTK